MANDTSKLTINNTTYDIKDANARCSKYQYTLNKNNWSDNTYALSVSASNIDCKCYNTIELSNYYDINQWKTYGISIESTEKNYDGTTDTTTLATIYFKCETVPTSNLTFAIVSFPSKTSIGGDLVNPYNDNDYTNADKALVQNSPITTAATGSNLTLSTSAGNIGALTVYGKSEIIDGEIVSAGDSGSIEVRTSGDNLFGGLDFAQKLYEASYTSTIDTTNKTVTFNRSKTEDFIILYNNFKANTPYTLTLSYINDSRNSSLRIIYTDNTTREIILEPVSQKTIYTIDTNTNKSIQSFALGYYSAGLTTLYYDEFGIFEGIKTEIDFEPYTGTMATFSTGTPLRGIPNTAVKDSMYWDGSSGEVTKNCIELDLGSIGWHYDPTTFPQAPRFFSDVLSQTAGNDKSVVAEYYTPSRAPIQGNLVDKTLALFTYKSDTRIYCINLDYTDATAFRTAMNGVKLIYELANPTIIPLTSSENASLSVLKTFSPTTHINNNASTDMTVEAYAGTANGKAVTEIADKIDVLSSDKETKSVELSYADYVALPTKDPETSYYVPDAPDTWIFGFDLDKDDENPFTRVSYPADVDNTFYTPAFMDFTNDVFNYGSWNFKPGEKFMPNPCMLLYNGTVGYYLNPNDNTKKADGTASDVANTSYGGNAMMEWGLLYTKRWEENDVYKFRVSNVRIDADWECWCNYDINNNVIPHFYTPIYFGSYDGTRMRSLSGQSNMVSTTAQQEIDRAKANGSDIWYTEVTADQKLIEDLAVLMCKSTAIQEKYGAGRISASSAIAPGTMNTKGMFWGDNGGTNGVKIFGMENPYGNIWRRQAGYTYNVGVQKIKLTRGTHDGSTATDYNITGDGYISISNSIITGTSGGYITEMIITPFGRFPKALGGSQTTYEADACWHNDTYNGCYALVGGAWSRSRLCGLFCVILDAAPSSTYSSIGASLSCKPLAQ